MKKIPTLFERVYADNEVAGLLPNVTPGMEWVLEGGGVATVKLDGSCCAVLGGEFYRRYDAKPGRKAPEGALKCQEKPDPVTGHFPHWVKCNRDNPDDKWFWAAYDSYVNVHGEPENGTYEALGKHFLSNPYRMEGETLEPHGRQVVEVERTFEGLREWLSGHYVEGLVFWKDGQPQCKLKRSDFGFQWNQYAGVPGGFPV